MTRRKLLDTATPLAASLAIAAASPAPTPAPTPGAPDAPDALDAALASLTGEGIAAHVEVLASDAFEGRAPSTPGEEKTLAYLREQLQRFGVEPPPGGSWFQPVPLVDQTLIGEPTLSVWRQEGARFELKLGERMIVGATVQRPRVAIDGAELVFVGHGIVAPEYGWDDYKGVDVRDKVVVAVQSDPGRTATDPTLFKGRALTLYGTPGWKQEEARRRGAAGFILIHDPDIIGYPWEALAASARHVARLPSPVPRCPPVGRDRAAARALGDPQCDRRRAGSRPGRRGRDLHRALGPRRHRHARERRCDLQRCHRQRHGHRRAARTGPGLRLVARAAEASVEGRTLEPDPQPEQGAFFRSDHYPFARKGVPAVFAVGGPRSDPPPSPEMLKRFQDYLMNGYHHAADEYDSETWDMRGIVGDARIDFRTGYAIANDDRMPNWYFDSEFRALRDAMLRRR